MKIFTELHTKETIRAARAQALHAKVCSFAMELPRTSGADATQREHVRCSSKADSDSAIGEGVCKRALGLLQKKFACSFRLLSMM